MIANYNVELLPYASTGSFRFWCQKVLPLVYDNSLSYYELLCKVVKYLNDVIQNCDNMNTNIDALNKAFNQLQAYVNEYFDELNVQQFVNAALDEMVDNGTFAEIVEPYLTQAMANVGQAIENQNNTIDNAIEQQNQTIDNKLDEVDNIVNGFSETIQNLVSRMNALVQSYGSTNMSLLYESETTQEFSETYTLNNSKENFEFLDIYYVYGGANDIPSLSPIEVVHVPNCYHKRVRADENYFMLDATNSPTNVIFHPDPSIQLNNVCTYFKFTDGTTFKRVNGGIWNWSGNSAANATRNFDSDLIKIVAIYGVRSLSETPQEITDIRVAWNGVVYPNAGEAVRAQCNALSARIDALQNSINSMPKSYYGYVQSADPDTVTKEVYITSDNANTIIFKTGDILYLECRTANTHILSDIELEIHNDESPIYTINRQQITWNSYDVLVLRFDGTNFQFISKSSAE